MKVTCYARIWFCKRCEKGKSVNSSSMPPAENTKKGKERARRIALKKLRKKEVQRERWNILHPLQGGLPE